MANENETAENKPAIVIQGNMNPISIYTDTQSFEVAQRMAKAISMSEMIPESYRNNLPNTLVALEYATRLKTSPLMIMQNLNVIKGHPSFSAKYLVGLINSSGYFKTNLRYEYSGDEGADNRTCKAWAIDKVTGDKLFSPSYSIKTAKAEGLWSKTASKWPNMPDLMLSYRAATMFANLYCPEITLGLITTEEAEEIEFNTPQNGAKVVKLSEEPKSAVDKINDTIANQAEPDGEGNTENENKPSEQKPKRGRKAKDKPEPEPEAKGSEENKPEEPENRQDATPQQQGTELFPEEKGTPTEEDYGDLI